MTKMAMILLLIALLAIALFCLLGCAQFGSLPSGKRLERIEQSTNFSNGSFKNELDTPVMSSDKSFLAALWDFATQDRKKLMPVSEIPHQKIDLFKLDPKENFFIWLGHSSFYLQVSGKRLLVDPVLSGYASPFSFSGKSFAGSDAYSVDDFPEIDYLIITHDHYDHLDYDSVMKLKIKTKKVVCGLGVASHLEKWEYDPKNIEEADWGDSYKLSKDLEITVLSARHYSGRLFSKNKSLWISFLLKMPSLKLYFSGDSGYGPHFSRIGANYGPFDLVFLDSGQYNEDWKYIHMMPEEALQAAKDLKASRFMPIHVSKFLLSKHEWKEPLERLKKLDQGHFLLTPIIGEKVGLDAINHQSKEWWRE